MQIAAEALLKIFTRVSFSLLALEGGNRRTADVRSKGYSQLFLLSKADFEEAMSDYPEAQKILRKKAKSALAENSCFIEIKLSPCV